MRLLFFRVSTISKIPKAPKHSKLPTNSYKGADIDLVGPLLSY